MLSLIIICTVCYFCHSYPRPNVLSFITSLMNLDFCDRRYILTSEAVVLGDDKVKLPQIIRFQ